jgi:hypothetical protein
MNDTDVQKVEHTKFAPTECEGPNTWTPTKYEEDAAWILEIYEKDKVIDPRE